VRRAARVATFLLVQAILLFALVEVGLRLMRPVNHNVRVLLYMPSVASEYDRVGTLPELLGRSIMGFQPFEEFAGFVRNSRGFRTREYRTGKEPGTVRVLAIGDSFTAECGGIPYSDMWHVLLERELARRAGAPVEILALGVPGVGPVFERRIWQLEGARLDADLLLLMLFVGNDFTDHYETDLDASPGTAAARWSFAVRFVRNAARALAARRASDLPTETLSADGAPRRGGYEIPAYREQAASRKPFLTREKLLELESQRIRLCERRQDEAFEELFRRLASVLADFRDEVEAAGVEFRVVVIPDRFQVNAGERAEILARLGMDEDAFHPWDMPQRRLAAFFEREGIAHLDLLPAYLADPEETYAPDNTHWNVRGSALAADRIAAWLAPLPSPGAPHS
jgi:lysophospholipase L1-like esterase